MLGLIDVGGGMRGAFTAGIYDYLMDHGLQPFDYLIGVSAGSANMVTYLAKQRGRSLRSYLDYAFRPQYMSARTYVRTGSYYDLNYIYDTICGPGGEDPVDLDALNASTARFEIVVTDAETGKPLFYDKSELRDGDFSVIKASSAIPVVSQPYPVHGRLGFDGGVSDPVPYERALEQGCDHLVVLLTKPREYRRSPMAGKRFTRTMIRSWPNACAALERRYAVYNEQVAAVKRLEEEGKALLVAPTDISGVDTLTRDRDAVDLLYRMGYVQGPRIVEFVNKIKEKD